MIAIARAFMDVVLATIVTKPNFYQLDCPMNTGEEMLSYFVQVAARYIM